MPKNFLSKMKFEIDKSLHFKSPNTQAVSAVYQHNNLTEEDILHNMNELASQFNSNNIHLGCAIHYKKMNKWAPAIMKPTSSGMAIWSPQDSPGMANAYEGDTIDKLHFMIVDYKMENHNNSFYTPKIGHHLH